MSWTPGMCLTLAGSFALAAGCDPGASAVGMGACSSDRERLSGNPIQAADAALARGETRLLAVRGFAIDTPGVDSEAASRYGRTVIANTSDHPDDASCERYQAEAETYAERYNKRVLERAAR